MIKTYVVGDASLRDPHELEAINEVNIYQSIDSSLLVCIFVVFL